MQVYSSLVLVSVCTQHVERKKARKRPDMKQLAYCVLVYMLHALQSASTQQYTVTVEAFNNDLRTPYHQLPLYCRVNPLPEELVFYRWDTSTFDADVSITDTSPYTQYKPRYNNPRFGRVFCYVMERQQFQILDRGDLFLEIKGYIEAKGNTSISLQPGERLMLSTAVSRQHSIEVTSPLLNVRVETEWRHNGTLVNSTRPIDELTLLIENVQEANTGVYELRVSHFYFIQDGNVPPLVGNQDRLCSRIILDALGLYAIFSPVEFQVSVGSNELPPTLEKTNNHYQFFEGKELLISFEVPLQQIRNFDYLQPPNNNFTLSFMLHLNGKVLLDTTQQRTRRLAGSDPMVSSTFQLTSRNTARVNITLSSPGESNEGLYEYQLYLSSRGVQEVLTVTGCHESYGTFLVEGLRLPFYLVGENAVFVTMASRLALNVSRGYLTQGDTQGVTLSCALTQGGSVSELSWLKNGHQLATTSSSSTLHMNTADVVGQQNSANVHGTYSCFAFETNGRHTTQYIHIPERASFSFQLRHRNGLDCGSATTTEAIMRATLSELASIFSTTCNCDITSDYITMEMVSCDSSVLTVSAEFTFSDEDGLITASNLLSSAANILIGERMLDNITLLWDTSCPLRDAQGYCIEGSDGSGESGENEKNPLTPLEIGLLSALALALMVIVTLTILIGCVLISCRRYNTRKFKQANKMQPSVPTRPHRPILHPEPSNDPQPYSYPQVHTIAGRHLPLPSSVNNTHPSNSGNASGENGLETNQNHAQRPTMESSLNCIPNPAYSAANNDNFSESTAHPKAPPGRHVYDYPQFEGTSLESISSDNYLSVANFREC